MRVETFKPNNDILNKFDRKLSSLICIWPITLPQE